jgi:mannitol/fructose-specific phosphotransferase system IIA component
MIDTITQDNLHLSCRAKNKAEVLAMIGADFKSEGTSAKIAWRFLLKEGVRSPPF